MTTEANESRMSDPEEIRKEDAIRADEWEEFRDDEEPIRIADLTQIDLAVMPESVVIRVMDVFVRARPWLTGCLSRG